MRCVLALLLLAIVSLAPAQYQYVHYDNVVYTQASGFPQTLDIYVPNGLAPARPAILFVHGGGWAAGSKEDFTGYCQYYASMGYVCATINYRLAPLHIWPAQIDDTQAAVRWMRKNANLFNLDPNRIGAVGSSAGGHLVLFLGEVDTMHNFDPALSGYSSKVKVVADYCGPTDLSTQSEWNPAIWALIQQLLGPNLVASFNQPRKNESPLRFVRSTDAPTIIFHGDADDVVPVDQSRRIVAKKQSLGALVSYYEFPGEGHGFTNDPFWISVNAMTAFFAAHL